MHMDSNLTGPLPAPKQQPATARRIPISRPACSPTPAQPGVGAPFRDAQRRVATPAGLEPATIRLEGGCSIQLSYGAPIQASCYGRIAMQQ